MSRLFVSTPFVQEWKDMRLSWPIDRFNNMTQFIVDSPLIWTPELTLINAYVTLRSCKYIVLHHQQADWPEYLFRHVVGVNSIVIHKRNGSEPCTPGHEADIKHSLWALISCLIVAILLYCGALESHCALIHETGHVE